MNSRHATLADVDAAVATYTTAFSNDPLWGPVFPDAAQASVMWRLCVTSALRYPWLLVTPNVESSALWIPPGGTELTAAEESELKGFVSDEVLAIYERLDEAHPTEPHFYLSLLGTHDDHRGRGLGMSLLAESLSRIDALGSAAYLESSNPANNKRYERAGFVARSEITMPSGHVVTSMWRPAR